MYIYILSGRYWIGLTRRLDCSSGCPTSVYFDPSPCGDNPTITSFEHGQVVAACCECRKYWAWLDQSEYDFQNWDYFDGPDARSTELCGTIARGSFGKWRHYNCDSATNGYVCKRPVLPPTERIYLPRKSTKNE